ncbi:hypothetical protein GCM10027275_50250 [Rhabdobacter roseus]
MKKSSNVEQWDVCFMAIWPCLAEIDEIHYSLEVKKETWPTNITFFSKENFAFPYNNAPINFQNSAFITIESKIYFDGDYNSLFNHYAINIKNSQKLIDKYMRVINDFIIRLKYSYSTDENFMFRLRNIGIIDLTIHNLFINNHPIYLRSSPAFPKHYPIFQNQKDGIELKNNINSEWILLTRAADLINIGYYGEGLIVSFALFDSKVQDFIKKGFKGLTNDEIDSIVRGIEKKRLSIYLGPLLKLLYNKSLMDNNELKKDLVWINKKRNEIMHNGDSCTYEEAVKALDIVNNFLKELNILGNNLDIPKPRLIY